MIRLVYRGTLRVVFIGACVFLSHRAQAQGLPKGESILDKYVAVTGGEEAYQKCKNRLMKGTMEFAGAGIKGQLSIYQSPPNKLYLEANFQGLGKFEEGTDGQTVWERNPITGARIFQGEERAMHLRQALFNEEVVWRKAYKKVECVGEEKVEGKACYKVELTPLEGPLVTEYFDKESGLQIKLTATVKMQMGDVPTETLFSGYKKVDGILMPHKFEQKALTQRMVITIDKVLHNIDMPADRFDLTEDIKKLAEKEKKDNPGSKK